MMPHTKGPWHYGRKNWRNEWQEHKWYVHGDVQECEPDGEEDALGGTSCVAVCVVEGNATSHPVCEDNARLICASPTMLDALEAASEALVTVLGESDPAGNPWKWAADAHPKVLAAIAKAKEGKS